MLLNLDLIKNKNIFVYGAGDKGELLASCIVDCNIAYLMGIVVSDGHRISDKIVSCIKNRPIYIYEFSKLPIFDGDVLFLNTVVAGKDDITASLESRFGENACLTVEESDYISIIDQYISILRNKYLFVYDPRFIWQKLYSSLSDVLNIIPNGIIVSDDNDEITTYFTMDKHSIPVIPISLIDKYIKHDNAQYVNVICPYAEVSDDLDSIIGNVNLLKLSKVLTRALLSLFDENLLSKAGMSDKIADNKMHDVLDLLPMPNDNVIFPNGVQNVSIFEKSDNITISQAKTAVIFAAYNADGKINDDTVAYLKAIKSYANCIIYISDNPVFPHEANKLREIVQVVICVRHGEYDWGSHKRGYVLLKESGMLKDINRLVLMNDSVIYRDYGLDELFRQIYAFDSFGYAAVTNVPAQKFKYAGYDFISYEWLPTYIAVFISMSPKIFLDDSFERFMLSIRKENCKYDIIRKYEIGISRLIGSLTGDLHTYYPLAKTPGEALRRYFSPASPNAILIKKSLCRYKTKCKREE